MLKIANKIENRFQAFSDKLDTWEVRIESWQGKASYMGVIVGSVLVFLMALLPFVILLKGLFDAN